MSQPIQEPLVLTVAEVAEYLKISRGLAYALVQRGELPSVPIGRIRRVQMKDVLEFLDAKTRKQNDTSAARVKDDLMVNRKNRLAR